MQSPSPTKEGLKPRALKKRVRAEANLAIHPLIQLHLHIKTRRNYAKVMTLGYVKLPCYF